MVDRREDTVGVNVFSDVSTQNACQYTECMSMTLVCNSMGHWWLPSWRLAPPTCTLPFMVLAAGQIPMTGSSVVRLPVWFLLPVPLVALRVPHLDLPLYRGFRFLRSLFTPNSIIMSRPIAGYWGPCSIMFEVEAQSVANTELNYLLRSSALEWWSELSLAPDSQRRHPLVVLPLAVYVPSERFLITLL